MINFTIHETGASLCLMNKSELLCYVNTFYFATNTCPDFLSQHPSDEVQTEAVEEQRPPRRPPNYPTPPHLPPRPAPAHIKPRCGLLEIVLEN